MLLRAPGRTDVSMVATADDVHLKVVQRHVWGHWVVCDYGRSLRVCFTWADILDGESVHLEVLLRRGDTAPLASIPFRRQSGSTGVGRRHVAAACAAQCAAALDGSVGGVLWWSLFKVG
jgi:hypothetical protein